MRRARSEKQRQGPIDLIVVGGWIGVSFVLLAYVLTSLNLLSSQNPWYLILNLTGSLGILLEAYHKKDTPALWLNIVWMAIALFGLVRFLI